jgi:hypothetical protein
MNVRHGMAVTLDVPKDTTKKETPELRVAV